MIADLQLPFVDLMRAARATLTFGLSSGRQHFIYKDRSP